MILDNTSSISTRLKKVIILITIFQIAISVLLFISVHTFANFETAFFTSMLVMLGSMYSYRKLVMSRIASDDLPHQDDPIDKIDDPYDLYGEDDEVVEDMDLKDVIKEEKKRLKVNTVKNTAIGAPAMVSLFRIMPYAVMVLGFIALNNNHILMLFPYLSGLGIGVVGGLFVGKVLFIR